MNLEGLMKRNRNKMLIGWDDIFNLKRPILLVAK